MASDQSFRDLQWLLHAINSDNLNLHSISFHLLQPSSLCQQETEHSINVNISPDSLPLFPELLDVLGPKNGPSPLKNMEFHQVEWDKIQLRKLGLILENTNVRQILFRRNRFSVECLNELSAILRENRSLKEMTVTESGVGSTGAAVIAAALRQNGTLEELQIWEDSIGSRGGEELSKMIESNSTLKVLTIFDLKSVDGSPLISAVLARNRPTELHIWSGGENGGKSSKVAEFSPENGTLRLYRLNIPGTCRVTGSLGLNSTVKTLDLTGIRLKSQWAKEFRQVLEQNRCLKEVNLSHTSLKDKAVVYIAAGLFKNQTLQTINLTGNRFTGIGIEHLLCPLTRFSSLQSQANVTLKTVFFGGGRTKIGRDGLNSTLKMLTTNQTVTRFGIHDDETLKPQDFVKIFEILQKNASLRAFSLKGCRGVDGELVLQAIMEVLQINPWIEEIELSRTPLQTSGKAEAIYQKLGQNERVEPELEIDLFKDMAMAVPKSCRVFICGQEYAGKTTLCNSISQNFTSSRVPYINQVRTLVNPVEQAVRTVGMKIKTLKDEETKFSIWNLAGQHEFYSLHDLMFPGPASPSFFVVVSSLFRKPSNREPKTSIEIEEDLRYWLRFIVSNSKRAEQQCMLPNVTIVLTHFDKIDQTSSNFEATVNSIQKLREQFHGFIEFYPTVFTVDARSSASASRLARHIRNTGKTVLQRVPRVYELCNDLVNILSDWQSENNNKPAMRWREFGELCQIRVPFLRIRSRNDKAEMRRRAAAICLHQLGEVIYFEELGFLILDCEWFCGDVLSQLVRLDVRKPSSNSGFVSRQELEKILKGSLQSHIPGIGGSKVFDNLEVGDLVRMMLKLELCYEQEPSDRNSMVLIPSILEEGRGRTQRWNLNAADCVYVGRHLECDDSSRVFLTPGFFPRLQVHLHNKIVGMSNQHGATYNLEKYLILIQINGIYARVELGGQLGHHIDILACSTKTLTETLRLLRQLIIPAIHSLCNGFTLTENVLRPESVKHLVPPRYRKTQFVNLQQLKTALLSVPADGMYDYQHTWSPVLDSGRQILSSGFDFARDLLSDDDFREVLHRRYHDLYNLASELQIPPENESTTEETDMKVDASFSGIAKGVEAVLQRLKIIEQEIRDLKQEIQGLRYYEHRLLIELHRKVNNVVNFNTQIEERKVPNLFYFVSTENYSRRLVTTVFSGMNALRLHMLCEFRREIHVVEDQMGCEMMQIDNRAVKSIAPYMKKFMKLLTFALKIGAHLAAGMGEMIPDLSREVSHLVDSPFLYGAAAAAGVTGAAAAAGAMGSRNRSAGTGDIRQDQRAAQQWVVDFLREQRCSTGKEIAEKFGLWRVRYRDDGQIAWICRRHMYTRANDIIEIPI